MAPKIDEDALTRLGYAVTAFRDGRACIVWNEDEHWIGAGNDDAAALASAVEQMFPSRIAREAVAYALGTGLGAATPAQAPVQQTQLRVVRPVAAPKPRAPDGDMAKLDELASRVAQGGDALARMSPELQRMTMFTWLARARDIEDRWPSDPRVSERVTEIAARLGGYAKAFWPGTVQALRVGTMPAESLFGLMRSSELRGVAPQSWADAAEIVEGALTRRTTAADFDGGYRDAEHAQGGGAEKLVNEAAKVIESVLGGGAHRVLPGVIPQLVEAAKKLRRARRTTKDGTRWGSLLGQLRALAAHDDVARSALREVLDPEHVPPLGWGDPPKPVAPKKPPAPVTPARDAAEAETLLDKARTLQALARAIAASHTVLDTEAIATRLDARRDDVARIGEAMMPDDDARAALAAVKARLASVPDAAGG